MTFSSDRPTRDRLEDRLTPIPLAYRDSRAGDQFWIWAGANIAPINWVLGALGVQMGLSLFQTVAVLVVGNGIGMAVFGLFVLMGQRTGVSQMVLSRSAFGRLGAAVPATLQGLLAVGWCAINTWIVLDLAVSLVGKLGWHGGTGLKVGLAIAIMAVQVGLAALGYQAIARFERWTVPVTVVVLVAMSVIAWTRVDVHWTYGGEHLHGTALWSALSTLMTAIGIGWGITWFAYASDYSRFVDPAYSPRRLYAASVRGQFVPTVWLDVLGATLAAVSQTVDPGQLIVRSFGALAVPVILLVLHGPIATNILNMYSCGLCAQTVGWRIRRSRLTLGVGTFALVFTCFLIEQDSFAESLDAWLSGLVTWVAPWATIMLVHYYGLRRSRIDVDALFSPPGSGRLPRLCLPAVVAFVLGAAATWAYEYGIPHWLQGPLATASGGVDLSWLAGAVVAGGAYVGLAAVAAARAGKGADAPLLAAAPEAG